MNMTYWLNVLRRQWWIIALGVIAALLVYAFFMTREVITPVTYEAEAELFMLPTDILVKMEPQMPTKDESLPSDDSTRQGRRVALLLLVKSPAIAERVYQQLQDRLGPAASGPGALLNHVEGSINGDAVAIKVTWPDPKLAEMIANAWAHEYEMEANTIFGQAISPANMAQEVERTRQSYEDAESQYALALQMSPYRALKRRLADRSELLNQILDHRRTALDVARLRVSELDRFLVDVQSLRQQVQAMEKPDVATYMAFLVLKNDVLAQEDIRLFRNDRYMKSNDSEKQLGDGVIVLEPESSHLQDVGPSDKHAYAFDRRLNTTLTLDADQVSALVQDTSREEMLQQIDTLIQVIQEKRNVLAHKIQQAEQDGTFDKADLISQLEEEVRQLEAQAEAEQARLDRLAFERDTARNAYQVILNKAAEVRLDATVGKGRTVVFGYPAKAHRQGGTEVSTVSVIGFVLAFLVGLLLSLGVVVALAFLDTKIYLPEQASAVLGPVMLGALPRASAVARKPLILLENPQDPFAQGSHYLASLLTVRFPHLQSLLVTSGLPREGKSTIAANLAMAAAAAGKQVILVDANLHAPALHRFFGLKNDRGLTTCLQGATETASDLLQDGPLPGLRILPAGQASNIEKHTPEQFKACLEQLQSLADWVIIDGPQFNMTDALLAASMVDRTLLVVRSGRENPSQIKAALHQLELVGSHVLGVLFNAAPIGKQPFVAPVISTEHSP